MIARHTLAENLKLALISAALGALAWAATDRLQVGNTLARHDLQIENAGKVQAELSRKIDAQLSAIQAELQENKVLVVRIEDHERVILRHLGLQDIAAEKR